MLTQQRRGVVEPRFQGGGNGGCGWRVAQRHGDIAQPAFMADAADGRAFHPRQELGLAPGEQLDQAGRIQAVARLEVGHGGGAGEAVPRTGQLAVIAAIDAVTQ